MRVQPRELTWRVVVIDLAELSPTVLDRRLDCLPKVVGPRLEQHRP
jgi:hypothetical protein